jgi:hypothetical protein
MGGWKNVSADENMLRPNRILIRLSNTLEPDTRWVWREGREASGIQGRQFVAKPRAGRVLRPRSAKSYTRRTPFGHTFLNCFPINACAHAPS